MFFNALVGTQLTLVPLAAPALTAGSICPDRKRKGTLTHLLVTDLSAAEIVLGKLAVRLIPVFSMVLCAFPVLDDAHAAGARIRMRSWGPARDAGDCRTGE